MSERLRVGLVGAGENTRARHIPGLRAIPDVEVTAVCNRRAESTRHVASTFGIPRVFDSWEALVQDPDIDAVVIGTWPYLHAPITVAALASGKHVLTEARLSLNAREAHQMLNASKAHPELVAQVVPSPYGLTAHDVVLELVEAGFLGKLREFSVVSRNASLADPFAPLHWRQDAALSGLNALTLGIVHETLMRWIPPPVRVLAQTYAFTPARPLPVGEGEATVVHQVGTPDSVQVLTALESEARGNYQVSGVTPFGQEMSITLYGTDGVLHYDLLADRLFGASRVQGDEPGPRTTWPEILIPDDRARTWTVEADFVASIREGKPVRLTDFETGVAYMEFTEAVARSAWTGTTVDLPLTHHHPHHHA